MERGYTLLIVLNGIEIGKRGNRRTTHNLLIVLNGIEFTVPLYAKTPERKLLIVLNGIEISGKRSKRGNRKLLIVLNGIEMRVLGIVDGGVKLF